MDIKESIGLLGQTARDKITGIEGIVDSVCFDLYGCVQASVKPPMRKDGTKIESYWYDVHRLTVINDTRAMDLPDFDRDRGPAEKPSA